MYILHFALIKCNISGLFTYLYYQTISVAEFVMSVMWRQIQYTDAMKAYHNSPAYQSWIAAKGKVDVDTESEEPEKTRRTSVSARLSSVLVCLSCFSSRRHHMW